jgi:two-component system sensor histidine kinase KdpD
VDALMHEAHPGNTERKHGESSRNDRPRGNLRLFFGGSAGLTAIGAMQRAARSARSGGMDIVVGFLMRTDGPGGDQLLVEFERVPPLIPNSRNCRDHRINVKAVLARWPGLVLIDTCNPSLTLSDRRSQNTSVKRTWFDIERLLAAGISVWASLDASGLCSWTRCPPCPPAHRWVALPRALYSGVGHG